MWKSTDNLLSRLDGLRRSAMFAMYLILALLGLILVLFASHCLIDWAYGVRA